MKLKYLFIAKIFVLLSLASFGQNDYKPVLKLNEDGSNYIKLGMSSQIWLRYTETNPGTGLYNSPVDGVFDISLRRTRFVLNGKLNDKAYFFVQFGQNNFNLKSTKYRGAFFHDVISEYHFNDYFHLGAGLTGWSGLLRYSSPSVGSIMSLDAPLYQQATNSINDQFLRKLSVYGKGSIDKFCYRVVLTNPMATQQATTSIGALSEDQSSFALSSPSLQYQGYFQYHIFDKESMVNPYTKGTYLGAKNVFTIGAGAIQQTNAMWKLNSSGDTTYQNMLLTGVDIYYESKMDSSRKYSLTFYGAFSNYNFGSDYIRNVGVNNPANTLSDPTVINGPGNNFPMIGTGNTYYFQVGYLRNINNEMGSKIQPYFASQISDYEYLDDMMVMFEGGINWYVRGKHTEKLTLNYQSRPVFVQDVSSAKNNLDSRASMIQLQMQLGF